MQIISATTDFHLSQKSAVAMGKFDGIHLGHQELLKRVLAWKKRGALAVIFTFDPSPEVFFGHKDTKALMTTQEKRLAFDQMGIDVLIEFPLNQETAATPPERFVREYLTDKLSAIAIVAGTDVSFGSRGAGDAGLLRRLAPECGYEVEIIEKVSLAGEEISSTLVREAIDAGDMEKAAQLLGEPYRISGVVVNGRQLGRKIGMPTVNLLPEPEKQLPPNGVYYSYVWAAGKKYPGISNIGYKPTVSEKQVMGVETYLYHFEGNLYQEEITVELLHFKRAEKKFDGVESLKKQMQQDMREGAAFHMRFS
ncbi:MAG: bifunctional riboflavin kinase/FAD synthetase [Muribaculaceae bacterium]|nr:bifunctional riboflavin kinase/FAD synthetase [Muribaculaceae bacterium]